MLSLLSGCELLPAQSSAALERPLPITELHDLNDWLNISTAVSKLSADMAATKLSQLVKPEAGDELFYYGALNQQLNHREGWIQARDAFRKLSLDTTIEPNLRELARIMEAHNQALINWHARHTHLQKELAERQVPPWTGRWTARFWAAHAQNGFIIPDGRNFEGAGGERSRAIGVPTLKGQWLSR